MVYGRSLKPLTCISRLAMAPRWLFCAALSLFAAVSSSPVSSLSVSSTPVAHDDNQQLSESRSWLVSSSDIGNTLRTLDIQVAGNVRVELDESLTDVAKVVVRSNTRELLELMDVAVVDTDTASNEGSSDGVRLHYKNEDVHVVAPVETRVIVGRRNLLSTVLATFAQNVVLVPAVVAHDASNAELYLATVGNTMIFVEDSVSSFSLKALTAHVSGEGSVQISAKNVQVSDSVSLSVTGDGHAALLAETVTTDRLVSTIAGKGKTWVQASHDLQAKAIRTSIVGGGVSTIAPTGQCSDQSISIAGSGHAFSGSIKCETTDVSIVGDGHAVVQTSEKLMTSTVVTGTVKYVGVRPSKIETRGVSLHRSAVSHADKDSFPVYEPLPAPTAPVTVNLVIQKAANEAAPYVRVTPFADAAIRLGSVSTLLSPGVGALVLFEVAVVVLALSAYSIMRFRQRRIREKYMALP